MITIVRALWGDEQILNWPSVLRDVQFYAARREKVGQDLGCDEVIIAYGQQNQRFLKKFGFDSVLANEGPVLNGAGRRYGKGADSFGHINFGRSMWRHKFDALSYVLLTGAEGVIWLDWDVEWDVNLKSVLETLKDGPAFQGRIRGLRNTTPRYGGACYYLRAKSVIQAALEIGSKLPYADDQTLITMAMNKMYFDGRTDISPEEHRQVGLDNPRLYGTKRDIVSSEYRPLFTEFLLDRKLPRFSTPSRLDRHIRIMSRVQCFKGGSK